MNHRVVNDVGYKKIYPMSLFEDDTFCHYCGRSADVNLQLEWDHVPALNVSIPEEFNEIRKTLVRSCRECNSLASDTPHLDYLERHFWLKAAYLRRYKKLLVNGKRKDTKVAEYDDYLSAVISNGDFMYESILRAIGFGVKEIEQIESPILQVKDKTGKKIENVLLDYLIGIPTEEDDDIEDGFIVDDGYLDNDNDIGDKPYTLNEFLDFLVTEYESGNVIDSHQNYRVWVKEHPDRVMALELPQVPHKHIGVSWSKLNSLVKGILHSEYRVDQITLDSLDCVDREEELDRETNELISLKDYLEVNDLCDYPKFIRTVIDLVPENLLATEMGYISWCIENPYQVTENKLPRFPLLVYNCSWDDIVDSLGFYR